VSRDVAAIHCVREPSNDSDGEGTANQLGGGSRTVQPLGSEDDDDRASQPQHHLIAG
jgi:hypothetical protein